MAKNREIAKIAKTAGIKAFELALKNSVKPGQIDASLDADKTDYQRLLAQKTRLDNRIAVLSVAIKNKESESSLSEVQIAKNEWPLINKIADKAEIGGGDLIVLYKNIICKQGSSRYRRSLGDIEARIPITRPYDEISFRKVIDLNDNQSDIQSDIQSVQSAILHHRNRYIHPHIDTEGYPCFSGSASIISTLRKQNNFGMLVDFLKRWLSTSTTGNTLYAMYLFPVYRGE